MSAGYESSFSNRVCSCGHGTTYARSQACPRRRCRKGRVLRKWHTPEHSLDTRRYMRGRAAPFKAEDARATELRKRMVPYKEGKANRATPAYKGRSRGG